MSHARAVGAVALLVLVACVPPRGGWDVDAVERSTPALAALPGQRLGDMIPFPALESNGRDDRIVLVACRYAPGATVRVRGEGTGWPFDWARASVAAIDARVSSVDVVLLAPDLPETPETPDLPETADLPEIPDVRQASDVRETRDGPYGDPPAEIRVRLLRAADGAGPQGMGDTLAACDVSPRADDGTPRGLMLGAEIRMRAARPERIGRTRRAAADEWVGAFLHELGHAMGFTGHAAVGDSVLVREARRLRRLGRRALEGVPDDDATLAALYALPVGARLGSHPLDARGARALAEARAAVRVRERGGLAPIAIVSIAGDRAARIAWRYADGDDIAVRMPDYVVGLRRGEALALVRERTPPIVGRLERR
jgi:hypothetical protein